jgi:hypothetical protein
VREGQVQPHAVALAGSEPAAHQRLLGAAGEADLDDDPGARLSGQQRIGQEKWTSGQMPVERGGALEPVPDRPALI